jgi:hypothetical protein
MIIMNVNELLAWAYDETQMADGMELIVDGLPEEVQPSVRKQIALHRRRSRWLDEQVAHALDLAEKREAQPDP